MAIVPARCQERLLIWGSSGGSVYGATSRLCCSGGDNHLKKAIYGLKQSPTAWIEKFSLTISRIGFHRYHSDHSLFVRRTRSEIVVLAVYINILLTESNSAGIVEIKMYLKRHFVTKDMGRPKYYGN